MIMMIKSPGWLPNGGGGQATFQSALPVRRQQQPVPTAWAHHHTVLSWATFVFKCFWQTSFGTPTACAPPRLIGPRYCSLASYYSNPLLVGPVKRVHSFSWQPMVGNWATKGGQLGNLWWSIGQPRVGYWAIFGKLPVNRQQSAHCHTVPWLALGTIWWAPFILFGGLSVSSFLSILICTYPFTNS